VTWNIRAYDLFDGKQLWQTTGRLPGHTGYYLYLDGDRLIVHSTEDTRSKSQAVLSIYDTQTGELLEQVKVETTNDRLLWRTTLVDYKDNCEQLSAVNRASGRTIWQIAVKDCVRFWPDLVGSEKIFSTRAGELFTADVETGKVKWRFPERCFSNAVVMDGIVYAICENGTLVGINRETGGMIGAIQFSAVETADVPIYWLATDGNRIFAYFGNSQELIAFEP
jgi:outer membrane protein assembly factor BamB